MTGVRSAGTGAKARPDYGVGMRGRVRAVLLPSVFLGPVSVEPLAEALVSAGWDVRTADPGVPSSGADLAQRYRSHIRAAGPAILVPHSNAGLFVPGLLADPAARGAVFLDARLPVTDPARTTEVALVPPQLRSAIPVNDTGAPLAWPFWWSAADRDGVFPSGRLRAEVERRAPRLPASLLSATVAVPPFVGIRSAYVSFGDTYQADRQRAAAAGWPTLGMDGGHLHLMVDPVGVAAAVLSLAGRAGLLRPATRRRPG